MKQKMGRVCLVGIGFGMSGPMAWGQGFDACSRTSSDALNSCQREAAADYSLELAKCNNLADAAARQECRIAAGETRDEALVQCTEVYDGREEICDDLGTDPYDPEIDPDDFVAVIDNPFFPLIPGTTFIYEADTDEGLERVEFTVTDVTREILGVTCTQIRDIVTLEGEFVEDTLDWFAQDKDGNVWYFGENVNDYEDGRVVSVAGSWEAGVDGARPGIIMLAAPEVDVLYRQEFFVGDAEDVAEVESLEREVVVPYGTFQDCLQTEDYTPLEPGHIENKYYAAGVGQVLTINVETGTRLELVEILSE